MIRQELNFEGPAAQIFDLLTNSSVFSEVTGNAPTDIGKEEGTKFSCFGGMIHGRTIELEEDKRIILAWRAKNWENGCYSIVSFDITDHGPTSTLILTHTGFSPELQEHLEAGWHENYWNPIKKYLQ